MSLIKRPPTLKMTPPGFHVVKRQAKISKNGIKYFVKAHRRKSRGKKIVLLLENILYLYWHGDTDFTRLGTVKGYPKHKGSSTYGLMQITNQTRRDAKNLNDGIVDVEHKDLEDPVINIAVGIRWLSYKMVIIPKK